LSTINQPALLAANPQEKPETKIHQFEDRLLQRAYEQLLPSPKPLINENAYMGMSLFGFLFVMALLILVLAVGQVKSKPETLNPSLVKTQLVPNQAETITPNSENQAYLSPSQSDSTSFSLSSTPQTQVGQSPS